MLACRPTRSQHAVLASQSSLSTAANVQFHVVSRQLLLRNENNASLTGDTRTPLVVVNSDQRLANTLVLTQANIVVAALATADYSTFVSPPLLAVNRHNGDLHAALQQPYSNLFYTLQRRFCESSMPC